MSQTILLKCPRTAPPLFPRSRNFRISSKALRWSTLPGSSRKNMALWCASIESSGATACTDPIIRFTDLLAHYTTWSYFKKYLITYNYLCPSPLSCHLFPRAQPKRQHAAYRHWQHQLLLWWHPHQWYEGCQRRFQHGTRHADKPIPVKSTPLTCSAYLHTGYMSSFTM